MHALTRALTAVLVVLAVAAPVASARIDPPPSERTQDLRHLAAGQTSPSKAPVYWSYDYQAQIPVKPITSAAPKGVYWAYEYEAKAPTPAAHHSAPATPSDDGIPWMTIGFIVAGAALFVSAAVVLTTRRRPPTPAAA
jgi:hypothetical protein